MDVIREGNGLPSPVSSPKANSTSHENEVRLPEAAGDDHLAVDSSSNVHKEAAPKSGLSTGSQLLPKDTEGEEAAIPAQEDPAKESASPSKPVMDASLSDSDADSMLSFKVRHSDIFHARRTPEDRVKKARKRHLQHVDYTNLMEYRIHDIEKRLEKIEEIDSPPKAHATMPQGLDQLLDISLDIKRMTFAEYKPADSAPKTRTDATVSYKTPHKHKPRYAFAGQLPYSLIDVVYADERPAPIRAPTRLEITPTEEPSVQPDRVRINSPLLLKALGRLSGHRFREVVIDGKLLLSSQVMLKPFKFFVAYEQKIRDEVKRLQSLNPSNDHKSEVGPQEATHNGRLESAKQPLHHRILSEPNDSGSGAAKVDSERRNQAASISSPTDYESKHLDALESRRCLEELQVLREFLDGDLRPTFEIRKQLREATARSVSFQDLWHLYTLGAEVVSNSADGRHQIFRVVETNGGRPFLCDRQTVGMDAFKAEGPHDKDLPKFEILAHTYESDGKIDSEIIVDEAMALLKTNIIPRFGANLATQADRRETKELLDPICEEEGCCRNTNIYRDYLIDKELQKEVRENKILTRDMIEADDELLDEDYLICPGSVLGYALRSRKWASLNVNLVEEIKDRGNGFDSLVLPEGHKDTLLALVQQSRGKELAKEYRVERQHMDLIRGKGKGLIILLHGEPGVGKTSTAESVAEYTRRPLLQVTCGDIGQDAEVVEKRLEDHFQLAHKWGCVLLLDEADVFLQKRSREDLARNAIVSVFLRVLEYYSGILFLTTNRVGAFDLAFRSRIHMSLFYPRLDESKTIKIWEMNLARARETWGDKLSIDETDQKEILEFASNHFRELHKSKAVWNGRQIRNAFQTAIALAEWETHQFEVKHKVTQWVKPTLEVKHFRSVAKASQHFDAYLRETLDGTSADLALEDHERRDDFEVSTS
ncbi:MAG: hypothetical protein Q9195_005454 [Heterodermia aff. obscurata]